VNRTDLSPVFLLTIAYTLGIILTDHVRIPLWLLIGFILMSLLLLLTSLIHPFRFSQFLPYLLFLLLGFFLTSLVILSLEKSVLARLAKEASSSTLTGRVVTEPKRDGFKTVFNFKVEMVEY